MDGIEHEFTRAVEAIKNVGSNSGVTVSDTQKIKCYGLFKQATEGDCKKAQPSKLVTQLDYHIKLNMHDRCLAACGMIKKMGTQ